LVIEFDRVDFGRVFHQTVYIKVKKSKALLEAFDKARESFQLSPETEYMPHLSLIYSDINENERQVLAEKEQNALFEGEAPLQNFFMCETVQLWYTPAEDKTLTSWEMVREYTL